MPDDDGKILQLEKELERLSSQLNIYREQLNQLRSTGQINKTKPGQAEEFTASGKTQWEFPSHTRGGSSRVPPEASAEAHGGLEKFIGLRLLHFAGIIALVIGISIGVKYAVDKDLITPATRIILAFMAGIILYFLSVRLRKKFELFSAVLLSGAMATLYFTSYAAFAYYELLHGGIAFALMLCITVFTIWSAIRYNKQEIAILGMIGAYGIPFLISANTGRADLFFTYIILINCGIAFLSFKTSWKTMSGLALFISWVLFIGWDLTTGAEDKRGLGIIVVIVLYLLFAVTTLGFATSKK